MTHEQFAGESRSANGATFRQLNCWSKHGREAKARNNIFSLALGHLLSHEECDSRPQLLLLGHECGQTSNHILVKVTSPLVAVHEFGEEL